MVTSAIYASDEILNHTIDAILEGKTQKTLVREINLSKPTFNKYLKEYGYSWKQLVEKYAPASIKKKVVRIKVKDGEEKSKTKKNSVKKVKPRLKPLVEIVDGDEEENEDDHSKAYLTELTQETVERYILEMANSLPYDKQVANMMINVVKEKGMLKPKETGMTELPEDLVVNLMKHYSNENLEESEN